MHLKYDYVDVEINMGVTELRGSNARQALHILECLLGRDFTDYYAQLDNEVVGELPKSASLDIEGFTFTGNSSKRTVTLSGSSNQGLACIRLIDDKIRTTYYAEHEGVSILDDIYMYPRVNARVDEILHELGWEYIDDSNIIRVLFTTQELLKRNGVKCVIILEPIYDLTASELTKLCKMCYHYGNYVIYYSKSKIRLAGSDHVTKYI